ncbi:MAG: hypothetical protein BWK80_52795 [Desulfobacteraceae bacterium IS3]|nr:MAG: hypothetical protein BWK80_52795 [Desulfobacteraceae bacterium IS3]
MTLRELIHTEIDVLNESRLVELYPLIRNFVQSQESAEKQSFMSKLQQIRIEAPEDFSVNLDRYIK